jgi:hypothetical protein
MGEMFPNFDLKSKSTIDKYDYINKKKNLEVKN